MEVQMAAQTAKSAGRSTPPHHHGGGGGAKPVPGYLRPSAGSCHHVCKYGGAHAFEDKEATKSKKKKDQSKPRKQPKAAAAPGESQSRVMGKVRSVFRRRIGDSSKAPAEKQAAAAGKPKGGGSGEEWKDIVAYDTTTVPPPHGSYPQQPGKVSAPVAGSGDARKKDVTKGHGEEARDETLDKKSAKPPKGKKHMGSLLVEKMAIDQELLLHGYQTLSPSLIQSRASLLRDLEKEMVGHEGSTNAKEGKPMHSLDDDEGEEYAAAAEASRPIPAHRRAKSMSVSLSSSRSVRYPFARQASRNSSAAAGTSFKLRSRSTKAPIMAAPPEEEERKPVRLRSRRGEDPSTGRGIQLRIRSLRRRGVGSGSGGAGGAGGFVVPAVALRHQKTLEKKKSRRLYNNVIEETASKLVKTRKSRVKALVGAFESVISKIAK